MANPQLTPKRFYGTGLPGVDPSQLSGTLIVIEGADGSGRTTQITSLRDWLERLGYATMEVGLKRSVLVGEELDVAMEGNILSPITMSLFYATDFADQLEHIVLPALRSGFVVLSDRYIYTLMARAIVRGVNPDWIRSVYDIALVPDAVFYLEVTPRLLAERTFRKNAMLDYWESGMDIQRSGDMYECFIRYQRQMQQAFHSMQSIYGFETIDGNRTPAAVSRELQAKIEWVLQSQTPNEEKKHATPHTKNRATTRRASNRGAVALE
jgi:dTMP kinase